MNLILLATGILPLTGLLCLAAGSSRSGLSRWLRVSGPLLAFFLALPPLLSVLGGGPALAYRIPWHFFQGSLYLELDSLSAFFLVPILAISALTAIYGTGYLKGNKQKSAGTLWLCFHLLVACMMGVVLARNALAFLLFWEGMSLTSFFMVIFESDREESRRAGWIYLVATHIGTAFLLILFLLLADDPTHALDFDAFHSAAPSACFLLALAGFGTKAGIMPFHSWLPEAHPAAPSHVSALMSGVMIKTGIYGILRTILILNNDGTPPAWWGWTLIALGLASGILGVLLALAQHDLKRLLAYSSVENIGIILLGLGIGSLGLSQNIPSMACLGFAGALFHILNHALFKPLLFLGAGSVIHATHTRTLDRLGGLLKTMPLTGNLFLIGSLAVSGLPPLNGFMSEFLIYAASFIGITQLHSWQILPSALVIIGLALIGGLAMACFTKIFGSIFLGEPREPHEHPIRESEPSMLAPMGVLAVCCFTVAWLAGPTLRVIALPVRQLTHLSSSAVTAGIEGFATLLVTIGTLFAVSLLAILVLVVIHGAIRSRRHTCRTVTWDCGYVKPGPRMQYTASSFTQPLTEFFGVLLRTHQKDNLPRGYFPHESSIQTETTDTWNEILYQPLFRTVNHSLGRLLALQQGRTHHYLLYILVTLLFFLGWWGFT